jgi:hypothetical protein
MKSPLLQLLLLLLLSCLFTFSLSLTGDSVAVDWSSVSCRVVLLVSFIIDNIFKGWVIFNVIHI